MEHAFVRVQGTKLYEALEPPVLIEPGLEVELANQVFVESALSTRRVPRTLIWSGTPHIVHNFHRKPKLRALVERRFGED